MPPFLYTVRVQEVYFFHQVDLRVSNMMSNAMSAKIHLHQIYVTAELLSSALGVLFAFKLSSPAQIKSFKLSIFFDIA